MNRSEDLLGLFTELSLLIRRPTQLSPYQTLRYKELLNDSVLCEYKYRKRTGSLTLFFENGRVVQFLRSLLLYVRDLIPIDRSELF